MINGLINRRRRDILLEIGDYYPDPDQIGVNLLKRSCVTDDS